MARGLDGRFDKLPHARLSHSPHHAMVACLTFEEGERPKLQNRSPIFCHKNAHKALNQLTIFQVFVFVLFVPCCG